MKKVYVFIFSIFSLCFCAFSEDFSFGDFGGDTATFGEEESEASDTDSSFDFSDFSKAEGDGSSYNALDFSGKGEVYARCYPNLPDTDTEDDKVETMASFDFGAEYKAKDSEVSATLHFDKNIADFPEDVLNELTMRLYLGDFVLEAGKMKVVWGKGDKLHVLDNFNADDYTNFLLPDYIDRRLAEIAFRAIYNMPNNMRIEGIYTPLMTPTRYAENGLWKPKKMQTLESVAKGVTQNQIAALLRGENVSLTTSVDDLLPETKCLKYGQGGVRILGTLGILDYGISYYYGHYKTVTANWENYINGMVNSYIAQRDFSKNTSMVELSYDLLQVFGLEAAMVLGPLNLRAEGCYNLTKDTAGDDPFVHNNSVSWLGGFDIDLPIHNINFNFQEIGTYILKHEKIGKQYHLPIINKVYDALDADYDPNYYTNNKIVIDIKDTFLHERFVIENKMVWGVERGDIVVMPCICYNIKDGFELNLKGLYIHTREDAEFDGWNRNSFVQLGAIYRF